eukprot:SAG31_NODE_6821_length_1878_cov_1.327150_2_plen_364_part_00
MPSEAQLLQLFDEIDTDGSGLLDREEVANLAESLGAPLSTSELDQAMLEMDEDGSGEVDFEEFRLWFSKQEEGGGNGKSKWAQALVYQLESYNARMTSTIAAMGSSNIDGSLKNLDTMIEQMAPEAKQNFASRISEVLDSTLDAEGLVELAPRWNQLLEWGRDQIIKSSFGVLPPTVHLLITCLTPNITLTRIKTCCKAVVGNVSHTASWSGVAATETEVEPTVSGALRFGLEFKTAQTAVTIMPRLEAELKRSNMKVVVEHASPRVLICGRRLRQTSIAKLIKKRLSVLDSSESQNSASMMFQTRVASDGKVARVEFANILAATEFVRCVYVYTRSLIITRFLDPGPGYQRGFGGQLAVLLK